MKVSELDIKGKTAFRFVAVPILNRKVNELWLKVQIYPAYELYSDENIVT